MAKKKITQKDREKLFDRTISKGENINLSLGQTIGHGFAYGSGYLTGQDVADLSNQSSLEELNRAGLIERYEKINVLSSEEKTNMTKAQLKAYDRENTLYRATPKLKKLYKEKVDKDVKFSKCNSVKHSLIQRAVYMSADRNTRMTFLNENDIEKMYDQRRSDLREQSTDGDRTVSERQQAQQALDLMKEMRQEKTIQLVDFAYRDEAGDLHFGEAITENYTKSDLQSKRDFVKALGYSEKNLTFYN